MTVEPCGRQRCFPACVDPAFLPSVSRDLCRRRRGIYAPALAFDAATQLSVPLYPEMARRFRAIPPLSAATVAAADVVGLVWQPLPRRTLSLLPLPLSQALTVPLSLQST